jgi:hypothetical protein
MKFVGRYDRVSVEPKEFDVDHYINAEVEALKEQIESIRFDCKGQHKDVFKAMIQTLIEEL